MLHFYFENNKYFIQFPNFKSLEESILEEIDYELKTDEKMIFYDKNNLLIETEEQYKNFKSESNQLLYVHILNKEEEEKKKKEEEEKKKKEEEKQKQIIVQPGRDGGDPGKKVNVIVDYKGLDEKEVKKMFDELDSEYNLASMFDVEEVLNKIVEFKMNREEMNKWIEDSL